MTDYERILEVKEDAEARLRALPGVHAVGISRKVIGGKPTDELCITVFLVEKKPLDRLAPEEVVPPEIDGVKTDVVQMDVPRLAAADPANLVATVSPDRLSVTFAGQDPPGEGLVIVLFFTASPDSSSPGAPGNTSFETASLTSLYDIAAGLADRVNELDRFTATASGTRVTLHPAPGGSCAIDRCAVTAIDDQLYSKDYLRGGIQLSLGDPHSRGTLGCLATTASGAVVALTCQHVVAPLTRQVTNLIPGVAASSPDRITFQVLTTDPIPPGTTVVVTLLRAHAPELKILHNTASGDTPLSVAQGVATAITNSGIAGVSASAASTAAMSAVVTVVGCTVQSCATHGPPLLDRYSDLVAHVDGLAIDLTGEVSGDDYGIFTNVNSADSSRATFSVYTRPERGAALESIAQSIARSIMDLPPSVRGSVTAAASATRITVSNAQEVECLIQSDRRVGQPDASFNPLPCFNHRIGRVLDARLDVDTALVQLDPGVRYKPEIEGYGTLTGTYDVQPADVMSLTVWKRGRTSLLTMGRIRALNVSGGVGRKNYFVRRFTNAVLLDNLPADVPFGLRGDSGSAVFKSSGELVGIYNGATDRTGLFTPIRQISDAFAALRLDVAPAPEAGHAPDDVRVVPAAARAAGTSSPAPGGAAASAAAAVAELVERNFAEARHLVQSRRRVATMWHRHGGRGFLETVLCALRLRQPLPEEIDGRPFAECLERLKRGLNRYASPELAADLARLGPLLACLQSDVTNRPAGRLSSGAAGSRPLR